MWYTHTDNVFLAELGKRWPVLTTILFLLIVAGLSKPSSLKKKGLENIPIVGKGHRDFMKRGGFAIYAEGYKKFKGECFRIYTTKESPSVIIPPKFLDELRKLPDSVLSFKGSLEEMMHSKYTSTHTATPGLPQIVGTVLTPALVRLNTALADEVDEAMKNELPQTNDWGEVNMHSKLLRIVAMAAGSVFVGPELCRTEQYLDVAINYTVDLMTAVYMISVLPDWLRPVISPILPHVRRLKRRMREADAFLGPTIASRRKAAEDPDWQRPDDMLQWILDSPKFTEMGDDYLARVQLGVNFAAIHTTTMTTLNALYTLAATPELTSMLRDEVQNALVEAGGVFTNSALLRMEKLDSFLKETLRYYPMGASSFNRKVVKPFTLSNGQVIPPGVIIEIPSGAINLDGDIHKDPLVFDALRFYNIRKSLASESKSSIEDKPLDPKVGEELANSQFVSVGASSLSFGYGRHACPGRYFAANQIKMILATALMQYDIKLAGGAMERYKNIEFGALSMPDSNKTLLVRKR